MLSLVAGPPNGQEDSLVWSMTVWPLCVVYDKYINILNMDVMDFWDILKLSKCEGVVEYSGAFDDIGYMDFVPN